MAINSTYHKVCSNMIITGGTQREIEYYNRLQRLRNVIGNWSTRQMNISAIWSNWIDICKTWTQSHNQVSAKLVQSCAQSTSTFLIWWKAITLCMTRCKSWEITAKQKEKYFQKPEQRMKAFEISCVTCFQWREERNNADGLSVFFLFFFSIEITCKLE